ncbi:MAG: plasmid partitioning protein RepB [Methylobacteriaceae bacterium]|nr:plasmid partitioning protein RepB [Methylobacteriaceae bacterium]
MSRKRLFETLGQAAPAARVSAAAAAPSPIAARFGDAVAEIRGQAQRAEQIEKALASGERIVEIDAQQIDPSPIRDRMASSAADDESLRDSIAAVGQQMPVLLRPAEAGRYVTVFGHRRIAAARALGRPVRAIVRAMPDADALVAQGVENAERRDLTFIERAQFARRLADAGLTQERIATAISAARSNVSLMVGLTRGIPSGLIEAIGRAPRLGQPRWVELAERLAGAPAGGHSIWQAIVAAPGFSALTDDARMKRVVSALQAAAAPRAMSGQGLRPLVDRDGNAFAKIAHGRKGQASIRIESAAPRADGVSFGAWLEERLQKLHESWRRGD